MAAPRLGSGERFRRLSGSLAKRGAHDPDALAAWIGRRKYGAAKMGRLSAHGHATPSAGGLQLAAEITDNGMECPRCGYSGGESEFRGGPGTLRTENDADASSAGFEAQQVTVRTGPGGAGLANTRGRAVELARRQPVTGPSDIIVSRDPATGQAVIRHRSGGAEIARMRHEAAGWITTLAGKDLEPRNHQRTALMDAVGAWNSAARAGAADEPAMPLQRAPVQTDLMAQYGIPAVRALATPSRGAGDGGRVTMASSDGSDDEPDDDGDDDGLNERGRGIRKRLKGKGMAHDRATAFARRAQSFKTGAPKFGQAAS